MTVRMSISELTSVSGLSILLADGEGVGLLRRSIGRLSPVRSEEKYVNFIDCACGAVSVGWRGLGLLPPARIAHTLLNCPENMCRVLCQAFTLSSMGV